MKGLDSCSPIDRTIPTYCGAGIKGNYKHQRKYFLKIGILLILFWTISSIWLIGQRRSERSLEEMCERKATVALVLPAETLNHR